jgi:hypothetical protein
MNSPNFFGVPATRPATRRDLTEEWLGENPIATRGSVYRLSVEVDYLAHMHMDTCDRDQFFLGFGFRP